MKFPFHYIVKAKLIRQTKENEFDFEEVYKEFANENPIVAREEAFSYYQSLIDVLLENKNKSYISDKQTREDLVSFIEHGESIKLDVGTGKIEFNDDSFENGIGVYFIVDLPSSLIEFTVGDEV